ncbi:ethionine resistance protein [Sparganum proliferum]
MLQALQNSDAELRREREMHSSRFKTGDSGANELEVARRRIEELTRENRVLTKSVEDAEKRCSNLQASLTATEESLRRLVEAVRTGKAAAANQVAGVGAGQAKTQSTSPGTTGTGADATTGDSLANIRIDRLESDRLEIERLREQLNEACRRNSEVEKTLIECEMERSQLKEEVELVSQDLEMARHETESLRQNIRETQTLQALVDTKESKILTLENEIRLLEDEITRLRDEGITTPNTSLSSGIEDVDRTLNTFRSNERLLKSKVDFLTSELSKRESEIYALQSRLEMTEKQQQDQNHHISVLKEQVKARENKVTMLTADIEDFRKRLKEKEGLLEKKTKLLGTNTTSKRQLETEVTELKDQIDLKERKISLLQRKIENLEELVTEKESQLAGAKSRLSRLNTEKTGSDGSKANLEDSLKEKDRQIERSLKENLQRLENETNEEMESQKRLQSELRSRLDISLRDLDEKTAQLAELREEMAQLRSVRYKRDTEISQLQSQIGQRDAEISSLKLEKQMLQKQVTTESEMKYSKIVSDLEGQVNHYMESASKLQTEVDRLLSMIRNSDSEKLDKDNQIHELEEQLHDAQNQINSLKRAQQMDRKKNAQFLDEARQRADNIQSDAEVLKNMMSEKEVRIRELEQALRESVRLTAEREAHVASREDSTRQLEQQIRELRTNVEHLQRERNNLSAQLASQQEELRDRESQLKNLESDCFQGYIPELEKLRRANQDANLKIAALIKLVHGHEEHLTEQDRSVLATIPMFPGFATKGPLGGKLQTRTWGPTSGSVPNVGLLAPAIGGTGGGASGTAYLGTGASTGGATSPHFAGSAFQLIGSNSAAATAAALSAGGISMPMQTADSVLLGRLLHEKETMLQQQLQDLTRLRFQNSEMEVKMKALQRDLENKNTRLNALESSQTADIVTGLGDWQTPMSRIQVAQAELTTLRQSNAELREKLAQAQTTLQERENELQRLQLSQTSAATLEIERLKLELAKIKEEREAMERNLRMEINQLTDDMNRSNNAAVNAEAELQDKKDKIRLLEFEQVKATTEAAALQKKYQTVLGQLTERTDKLQLLEKECQQNHMQEIQRLKSENEDLNHRVTYLHRNNQEREAKLEQQETELSKQKDELSNVKKQAHCLEAELKSLREEIAYKDERSRQLQVQHADELARMRSVHQEQSSRLSHLQLALDEKDHELKTLNGDLDKYRSELEHTKNRLKETETERNQNSAELVQRADRCRALELECQGQADELVRIQSNLEDAKAKSNILQKRVEEREQRLRKIEGENHGLLDEIHGLRKSNHELESHIDVLRQRLLDRDERSPSTVPILPAFSQSGPGISPSVEKASLQLTAEVDRLKKQNIELEASNNKTKQALQDLQIKMDQLDYERSNLSRSYEEEREKRTRLEKELHGRDAKMQKPVPAESTAQANAQVEQLTLTVSQLKRDIERRDSQIQQLNQQIVQTEKLSKMSTATGSERDVLLNELRISLQRTQQALDEANEQNHLLQARTETTMLETQQQFLIQQQSLQQQIANLQQSLHEAGMNSDRLQKEVRQSSTRIQDLTRQLRETQANCDSIASQRDSLQSRIEQLQQSGVRSGGSVYGGRPASVAAGYSDLISSTTNTSQLSRELDRLHREQESMRNQLESAERNARGFKTEAENARAEVARLKDELQQQKDMLNELQENLESREEEMSKRSKFETEKLKKQQQDLTNQIANLQKQVTAKDNLKRILERESVMKKETRSPGQQLY